MISLSAPLLLTFAVAADLAAPAVDAEFAGAIALAGIDFATAVPANGGTIPKNGRLLVFGEFFEADGSVSRAEDVDVTFERVDAATGARTPLAVEVNAGVGSASRSFIVDLGDLAVGETVAVECAQCFNTWTATVIDAEDADAPVFNVGNKNRVAVTDLGVERGDGHGGYIVRACIPAPIDDGGGLVVLRTISDRRDALSLAFPGGAGPASPCGTGEVDVAAYADGAPRTFCYQTLAMDASGNQSLYHELICAELPPHVEDGGCSQATSAGRASAANMAGALILLVMLSRLSRIRTRRGSVRARRTSRR